MRAGDPSSSFGAAIRASSLAGGLFSHALLPGRRTPRLAPTPQVNSPEVAVHAERTFVSGSAPGAAAGSRNCKPRGNPAAAAFETPCAPLFLLLFSSASTVA